MAKIPKFIDKIIYTNNESYYISSSFKGILRLSPNDIKTYNQNVGVQLSVVEQKTGKSNYADCIDFADDINTVEGAFTDCDVDKTMILCTDSDGYAVGFRLSRTNPEFDNLGVIGITEANELHLYTDKNNTFTINGQSMPINADTESRKAFLKMNGEGDWEYFTPDEFIKDTIIDILRSFETVPTGSIHWCPVTIDQYKKLCEKDKDKNNLTYSYTHNQTNSDPLVRDFLVCDGRKYRCADFPELAKILKNEQVSCHVKKQNKTVTWYYPSYHDNSEEEKYFYVPDLRHMFISSVMAKGIHGTLENASSDAILSPDSGTYTPDCNVDGITIDKNQHRHFTAYGTWQVRGYSDYVGEDAKNDIYPNTKIEINAENGTGVMTFDYTPDYTPYTPTTPVIDLNHFDKTNGLKEKQVTLSDGDIIGIMPLHNHPYAYYTTKDSTNSGGIIGFGQRIGENNRDSHSGANSVAATYFLSRPNYPRPTFNIEYIGKSSYDINSFDVGYLTPTNNTYDSISNGHENKSKFYAMLPLIKI